MLVLGGLYRNDFNHGICRIIGLDEFEVFYDCDTYDDKWMFSGNFKKMYFFTGLSRISLRKNLNR